MFTRLIATAFAAVLALPVLASDLKEFTDEERAQFRAEVRSYLMENPEVIMEAVALLQNREAEAQAQADLANAPITKWPNCWKQTATSA